MSMIEETARVRSMSLEEAVLDKIRGLAKMPITEGRNLSPRREPGVSLGTQHDAAARSNQGDAVDR